jgi:hypothetical protein
MMALKDLVIPHKKALDLKTVQLIDRMEQHLADIQFPIQRTAPNHDTIVADYKAAINLLLDCRKALAEQKE